MKSKRILVFFIAFAMLLGNMSQAFAIGTSSLSSNKAPKAYSLKKAHSPRRAPVATVNQEVTISIEQLRGIDGNDFNWDILPSGKLTVKAYYKSGEDLIYSDSVEFTKNDIADKNVVMTIPSNADSIDSFGIASDINDNVKINATVTSGAGAAEHDGIYTLKFDVTQTASPVIDVKWQDPYGNAIEGVDGGKINISVGEGEDASTAKPMLPSRAKQINLLTEALDYTEYGDTENKTLSKIDTVDIDGNVALDISLDGQTNPQGNITISGTNYKYIQNYDPQKGASILLISQPIVLEPNKDGDGNLPAVPDGYHRLTFDATNEGKIGTEQTKVIDVLKGTKYNNATLTAKLATIVAVPNSAEKVFDTWAPKVPTDETVVDKYMPDGATAAVGTYIAKYVDKKNVLENDPKDDNYVELKFNSGDGHFGNDKTDKVRTLYVLQSKKWSVIKNDSLVKKYMPPENVGLTAPAKKMFDAWSKDKKLVDDAVMKDLSDAERTLTAKYIDEIIGPVNPGETPNPDEKKYWTVTFVSADKNTGTVAKENTFYVDKKSGKTLADVTAPKTMPAEGYSFEKWTPALDNKTAVDKDLTVTGSFTKDVIGPVNPGETPNPDKDKYWTVTFVSADKNTGTVAKENTFYVDKKSGKTLADVKAPKTMPAEGYSFEKWTPALDDKTAVDKDLTVTGTFTKDVIGPADPKVTPNPDNEKYWTVTFKSADEKTGTVAKENTYYVDKKSGKTLADVKAPKTTPAEGYSFEKWTPALDNKTAVDKDLTVTGTFTKDVIGPADPKVTPNPDENKYWTVTFKSADEKTGTVAKENTFYVDKKSGKTLADVKAPKTTPAEGYSFEKWTPALDKNTKVDKDLTVTGTFTKDVVISDKDVIPFDPKDPKKPSDPKDPNIPTKDDEGKTIEREKYVVIGFNTDGNGTVNGKPATSFLVKKGVTFDKIIIPTVAANANYKFDKWSPALAEKNSKVEKDASYKATFNQIETSATPEINQPTEGETTITGTATPNATVTVTTPEGDKTTTADNNGNWTVTVTTPLEKDQVITAKATEEGKNPSKEATTTVRAKDTTPAPKINQPTEGETTITGTATPNATVTVTTPEGEKTTTADKDGNWTVTVTTPLVKDQVITAKATENGKKPSDEVTTTVKEKEKSKNPTITQPKAGDTTITGSATPVATVTVDTPEGPKTVTADANGNWTVTVTTPLEKDQVITATSTEEGKTPSDTVDATVIAGDLVSIIFDLNGGMIGSMTGSIKKMYNIGDKIVIMEAPQRKGYKFLYWKATENHNPGDTYKVVGEQTFVAQWEKLDSDKPNTGSSDNTGSKVTKPSAPNTGDQSDLYSYGLMTAIALLLLRGLRKKKCEF